MWWGDKTSTEQIERLVKWYILNKVCYQRYANIYKNMFCSNEVRCTDTVLSDLAIIVSILGVCNLGVQIKVKKEQCKFLK